MLLVAHDPGSFAWVVVAGYVVAALLALAAGAAAAGRERKFWLMTAAALLFLGINKQLDLQTGLTYAVRVAAHSEGWYASRRHVQALFLLLMFLASLGCAAILVRWLRSSPASVKTAAGGLVILLAFIFIRAASFHHIDYWVTVNIAGLRSGWWLELLGIAVIAGAAAAYRRSAKVPPSTLD